MSYTVYKHTSPSGKVYIGITNRNPVKRWGRQGIYYKGSKKFYNAIQKYGWDNILHEILFIHLTAEEAKIKEQELISHYKAFDLSYNITDGGDGSLGVFPNEETRRKIGEKSKGRVPSIETRRKISNALKGIKKPDGFGKRLSETLKGRKQSAENREKNRLGHLGQKHSRESIEKQRQKILGRQKSIEERLHISQSKSIPIVQCNLEGNFIAFWESARQAFLLLGLQNSKITACCKGKLKQAYGYKWYYLSTFIPNATLSISIN